MEALWSLEEKWKVSTEKAMALFACTSLLVMGVCIAAAIGLRRKWRSESGGRCSVVKAALMGSVRWSKWEDNKSAARWPSHNSTSAVWQRPILMGEKCELPRYSGLILYDHKGMPLHQGTKEMSTPTTLKDLL